MTGGADVRSLRRELRGASAGPGRAAGRTVTDMAYAVVCGGLALALLVGVAGGARDALLAASTGPEPLAPGLLRLTLLASLVVLTGWAALRLGPVGVPGHVVQWWLPLPIPRRGLLLPGTLRVALLVTLLCAGASVVVVTTTLDVVTTTTVLVALATGAEVGSVTASVAGLLQVGGRGGGAVLATAEVLVGVVPAVGAVLLLLAPGPLVEIDDTAWWSGAAWPVLAAGAAVCVALSALWARGLGRLGAAALSSASTSAEHATGATLSLDTRELGRALARHPTGSRRSTRPARGVRGPRTALVAAEGLDLLRDPGALARILAVGSVGLVAQQVPVLGAGPGLAVVLVSVGLAAGVVGARGARTADVVPALDGLLPLGARATRRFRCVVPALAATVAVHVALAVRVVEDPSWVLLGPAACVALGAAAVRGAYRPLPDWSSPLLATPSGALSTGAVFTALRGPDLAVLCTVPTAAALVAGAPSRGLVAAQVLLAVLAVGVAGRRADP